MSDPTADAVARAFRDERAAVLATLIRHVGDFQLAEDAVQDAYAAALTTWPREGVPANPGAWLTVTARRRAIDRLRRDRSVADRAERLADLVRLDQQEHKAMIDESSIVDDRLRLIFTCCHPALDVSARVALTLRALGGLTTGEIARAFLVAEPTMGKRIVRAKGKIAAARIPYEVPADEELPDRVRGVLRVVYLIFNEGYSATEGDRLVRDELCDEAIRLGKLLAVLMPDEPEALGLLALMLLHDSRRSARVSADGELVLLDEQDRSHWDSSRIGEGIRVLDRAAALGRPGPYQLQAAIAACHAQGADATTIVAAYDRLVVLDPSPVARLNRAVAIALAGDVERGLDEIDALEGLDGYQPYHVARADLLRRLGSDDASAAEYSRALDLTANEPERRFLERRLNEVAGDPRE